MDRTALVPAHQGSHVLPNSPFFGKVLRHARRGRIAIRDVALGVEKTYEDLLADALALRAVIEDKLDKDVLKQLQEQEEVFVGVLAAGGYEFSVAVVATLALGAAVVPMCKYPDQATVALLT
jgi:malonyl-CoA/methylmalonyl-CoA synthetase